MKKLAAVALSLMVLAGCDTAESFCDTVPDLPQYSQTCP